jgi:hypothetical protein
MEQVRGASGARRRTKGRWSGVEAKYQFLLTSLCDKDLGLRLDELKGKSHWWPWLSSQADDSGDKIKYLCPTYVLYDALSTSGRGKCAFPHVREWRAKMSQPEQIGSVAAFLNIMPAHTAFG